MASSTLPKNPCLLWRASDGLSELPAFRASSSEATWIPVNLSSGLRSIRFSPWPWLNQTAQNLLEGFGSLLHIQPCSLRERFLLLIQLKGKQRQALETGDTKEETPLLFKASAERALSDHCNCCALPHRETAGTSPSMLRATLTVARRVPKEGATSESKAGVVKLNTKSTLYSARSSDCGETGRGVSDLWGHEYAIVIATGIPSPCIMLETQR